MKLAQITLGLGKSVHRQGLWWFDAPIPRRLHLCSPWTHARLLNGESVDRCACGAIRYLGFWMDRNTRRRR